MKDKAGTTIKEGDICHGGDWIEYINEIVNLDGDLYVKPIFFRFKEIWGDWKKAPDEWKFGCNLLPLEVYGHSSTGEQTGVANSLGVLYGVTLDDLTLDWVKEIFKGIMKISYDYILDNHGQITEHVIVDLLTQFADVFDRESVELIVTVNGFECDKGIDDPLARIKENEFENGVRHGKQEAADTLANLVLGDEDEA